MVNKSWRIAMACSIALAFMSCENQKFNDTFVDSERVHVDTLSTELQKVRDYVPQYAVVAHRGSTYWTPEETEAAYRWAREMGADYLEADLQVSKDGVILALHDTDLKRTTNIEDVFGERFPEKTRREYYDLLGYSAQKIDSLIDADKKAFVPNYPCSYTYYELMLLDAGTWFNQDAVSQEQARIGFSRNHQYISTLQDLIMYSKGFKLERYAQDAPQPTGHVNIWGNTYQNERVVKTMVATNEEFSNPVNFGVKDKVVRYGFGYVKDDLGTSGNIPGIYIEFKEPWLNPSNFEQMVYNELKMENVTGFWLNEQTLTPIDTYDTLLSLDGAVEVLKTWVLNNYESKPLAIREIRFEYAMVERNGQLTLVPAWSFDTLQGVPNDHFDGIQIDATNGEILRAIEEFWL